VLDLFNLPFLRIPLNHLNFVVNFSENVFLSGANQPYLIVKIGGAQKHAHLVSGSGTTSLIFRYVIEDGLFEDLGVTLGSNIMLPTGTTLRDAYGNNAALTLLSTAFIGVRVDSVINS